MPSFSIPLTGLEADSTALNTIANNLANLNTTAFKAQNVTFSDLFYQQIGTAGSGDPIEVGAGTQVASTSTDFTVGSTTSTGNASNVALEGSGFFVVQNNGEVEYTRDGTFNVNTNGFLVTQSGLSVLGYPSVNGVVKTDAPLAPIQVPVGQVEAPKQTQNLTITANLNASAGAAASNGFTFAGNLNSATTGGTIVNEPITLYDSNGQVQTFNAALTPSGTANQWNYALTLNGVAASANGTGTLTFNPATGALTSPSAPLTGITFPATTNGANPLNLGWDPSSLTETASATALTGAAQLGGASANTTSVPVPVQIYDSLGEPHNATVTFTKDLTGINQWKYSVTLPPSDAGGAVSANASGTLNFSSSGVLSKINGVAAGPATSTLPLTFAGLADGAANLSFNWNLYGASGQPTITQVASASGSSATNQDGYAGGEYTGYTIDGNGVISAQFSNSQTTAIGQLGVASITNEQGLTRLGDNNYETTLASGEASTGVANSGGRGAIHDSALEASNVDISTEFADLIVAQRAFEANSKAVTTFDTVAQETINLIH
ncbi:Flagellar hook protein FlgE [Acidisarcina polymorpha]|uniref:Flagellar hook protein FlgE n=1 Tax=Acidisarcina polymorpha TaxID=2211140 RepID=A0A2Z5FSR7_9BACT|nr:flagellar hook-basal body complex protein [Acidisarcina polymorpha]AXC09516.1 Flagellar hook protein FlgE [Acidisarcina polymorpha]